MTKTLIQSVSQSSCLTLTLLILAACGKRPEDQGATRTTLTVWTQPAQEVADVGLVHATGSLEAERSYPLSFATAGTVQEVRVSVGQTVHAGEVLARLAPQSYQDALAIAQARAAQAEDAYRRYEPMHRNGTLADARWVEVESGVEQARRMVSLARKNLSDADLRSPVAGVVTARMIEPGTVVPNGLAITVAQTGSMLAVAPIPEGQIGQLKRGSTVRVTVPAVNRQVTGQVKEIGVVANPMTRAYPVKVVVGNADGVLRVGMLADVDMKVGGNGSGAVVVVPPEAVRLDDGGNAVVYVVNGTVARRRRVSLAGFLGEGTAIRSGLAAGEAVITSGTPMLADGLPVKVVARPRTNGATP